MLSPRGSALGSSRHQPSRAVGLRGLRLRVIMNVASGLGVFLQMNSLSILLLRQHWEANSHQCRLTRILTRYMGGSSTANRPRTYTLSTSEGQNSPFNWKLFTWCRMTVNQVSQSLAFNNSIALEFGYQSVLTPHNPGCIGGGITGPGPGSGFFFKAEC